MLLLCSWTRHGVFVQSCAELCAAAAVCVLEVLSTGRYWRLAASTLVHYTGQGRAKYYRMDTEYSSPPPLLCSLWLKS